MTISWIVFEVHYSLYLTQSQTETYETKNLVKLKGGNIHIPTTKECNGWTGPTNMEDDNTKGKESQRPNKKNNFIRF